MNREEMLLDLHGQIHNLTRLHIRHRLENTEAFRAHQRRIADTVREHDVDVRRELDPMTLQLYRRYFL